MELDRLFVTHASCSVQYTPHIFIYVIQYFDMIEEEMQRPWIFSERNINA